jgi:hypothetical protein
LTLTFAVLHCHHQLDLSAWDHPPMAHHPPVGSAPKSFPHFQHPSHALLEANGFKQQKYVSITCISSIGSMAYHES